MPESFPTSTPIRPTETAPPPPRPPAPPLDGLRGLGYMLLGGLILVYAVLHYACWVLPRCAWMHWTGQIPAPSDPARWRDTNKDGKF